MAQARDVTFKDNIVFGSLSVSLSAQPAAISPRLPFADREAILENGEPNLLSALRWEYGLTSTLRGRDKELAAILEWAEDGGNTVSARLVTGPGGAGKTRLAAEAARILRQRGWSAGFLPRDAKHSQIIDVSDRDGGGLLLAIDYPEERPGLVEDLLKHITDIANPPLPIRFLLLSRRGFDDSRADRCPGWAFWPARTRRGRSHGAGGRARSPAGAAETFAQLTGAPTPSLERAEDWLTADPARRLALMAMAAGVHSVLSGRSDFALGAPELMRELARRELQRVRGASRAAGLGEYGLERLLALALWVPSVFASSAIRATTDRLNLCFGMGGLLLP